MTRKELAQKIDHTLLKPEATEEEVRRVVLYAKETGTASVCLNSCWVPLAAHLLHDSDVKVCTVIGFPFGAASSFAKAQEACKAYEEGARELDMVLNFGALKSGLYDVVRADIRAVVTATPAPVKVILETCHLTDEEIVTACKLAAEAGAHYVKTSTGFGPAGATPAHVRLMRSTVPEWMGVKAAGGIGTLADAMAMLQAGASRIGASHTASILAELEN